MDDHDRSFSFVDRVTSVQPGVLIRGHYAIPPGLDVFPASLVAEAVGQLAAWAAMAAVQFRVRPVAGIAGRIDLLTPVRPGQTLELAADLESVDEETAAYGGTALADGVPVIRLQDCVGPMVPMADFDDPQAVQERFQRLCGPGAAPGGFGGLPALALDRRGGEAGQPLHATFQVPVSDPLFADHFPRRPVFPGSVLMHMNLLLAAELAAEIPPPRPGARWALRSVSEVKLRAFIAPGDALELEAHLSSRSVHSATLAVETRKGKQVVSGARVLLAPEDEP